MNTWFILSASSEQIVCVRLYLSQSACQWLHLPINFPLPLLITAQVSPSSSVTPEFTCNQPQYLGHRVTPAHCWAALCTVQRFFPLPVPSVASRPVLYPSLLPDPQKPKQLPVSDHFYLPSLWYSSKNKWLNLRLFGAWVSVWSVSAPPSYHIF